MSKSKPLVEIPPEIEAEMTPSVKAFVRSAFAKFEQRIAALEGKVEKLTPRNSSVPPGSEHPHAKPKRKSGVGKKRKQGGQKGHKRHLRELVPVEQCTSVTECFPEACRRCGGELEQSSDAPQRHQVWELPPIEPIVDEYQLFRGQCPCCGITTTAALPDGVPTGQCGPRLAAFTGLLMGHFRQSKRRASMFLGDLLNIPCSPAWTVKIQNLVSDAIAAPYEQLRRELEKQPQLFVDESPTKEKKMKAWLWVAVAQTFAVFGIFGNRSRESLAALVGDYSGIILNCDRAKMYLDGKRLQWCWAHLKRDIQKLIDSPDGQVRRLGHDLMRQERLLFEQWRRYKAGEITWRGFRQLAGPIRSEFNHLLLRGRFSGNATLIGFCNELWPRREHLWTFLEVEGIEPTNNTAERTLRQAVIYRKLSFGTQSARGSRYLERILTVSETCRLQNRSAYEYLIEAMRAKFSKQAPPSLLPNSHAETAAAA
jgi:IS1 family transposase